VQSFCHSHIYTICEIVCEIAYYEENFKHNQHNPLNIVRLLLASISSVYLTETEVTEAEIELKEYIQKLLFDSISHYNGSNRRNLSRSYQEPYKLHNSVIVEDDEEWSKDNLNSHTQCSNDDGDFGSLIKDELLNIGGIRILKKIARKGIR